MKSYLAVAVVSLAVVSLFSTPFAESGEIGQPRLVGKISTVERPETVWLGAIEVRLRSPFIFEDKREAALTFMKALAVRGHEVECRLTGERTGPPPGGVLLGNCVVFGPEDGREIDVGGRLIERGFARPCKEPAATIAIWPPVFNCQ